MDLGVSVCIITKNECDMLRRCLDSLKPYGFDIVVVDTGSEDETIDMVRSYTDGIYEFKWIDDFAAARNFAVSKAKYDTILVIDSDEYFLEGDVDSFAEYAKAHPQALGQIRQRQNTVNELGEKEESYIGLCRVFDRRYFHYAGRIHEQLVRGSVFDEDRDDGRDKLIERQEGELVEGYYVDLLFVHEGYGVDEEQRKNKAKRNAILLRKEVEKYPDQPDLLYQTAKSVYVAEGPESSLEYYERALSLELEPMKYWVRDLICCYGYVLLELERYEQAMSLEAVYDELSGYADYLFLMGLIHMNNGYMEQAVEEFINCTKLPEDKTAGTNSYKAYYNAGVIYECMGDSERATEVYSLAGDYYPAREGLKRVKSMGESV